MTWRTRPNDRSGSRAEESGNANVGPFSCAGSNSGSPGPFEELPPAMKELVEEVARHRLGKMTLAPEQMDFLVWLANLMAVRDYLEIGSFVGLNVLSMALRGPRDMRIHALDVSVTHMEIARRHWRKAGVDDRIVPVLQSALLTLDQWLEQGVRNRFDLILIDADKEPTPRYFEMCSSLLRPRGVVVVDNVHLGGRVFRSDHGDHPPSVAVMAEFLASTLRDPRFDGTILPLGDGMLLARLRE